MSRGKRDAARLVVELFGNEDGPDTLPEIVARLRPYLREIIEHEDGRAVAYQISLKVWQGDSLFGEADPVRVESLDTAFLTLAEWLEELHADESEPGELERQGVSLKGFQRRAASFRSVFSRNKKAGKNETRFRVRYTVQELAFTADATISRAED